MKSGIVFGEHWIVGRRVGGGGMADVYEVTHRTEGWVNALKVWKAGCSDAERFVREARLLQSLSSPRIVVLHDFAFDDVTQCGWMRLDLVPGKSLLKSITTQLSSHRLIDLGIQICEALEVIHARGIVHRDLALDNVMLYADADGADAIKLLDFGVAKELVGGEVTDEGALHGKWSSFSPEQLRKQVPDIRSDLYALGVMLYRLATLRHPYEAEYAAAVHELRNDPAVHAARAALITAVCGGNPAPPSAFNPGIDPGVVAAILRLLEPDREARFASAAEVRSALAAAGDADVVLSNQHVGLDMHVRVPRATRLDELRAAAVSEPALEALHGTRYECHWEVDGGLQFTDGATTLVAVSEAAGLPRAARLNLRLVVYPEGTRQNS
jgi:serine/threonine-protein kinase